MLYFLLFNIAPTIVELAAVLIIFWTKFSFGLASATALMVVVYIIFTRKVTDWRNALRTRMNDLDTLTIGRRVDKIGTGPWRGGGCHEREIWVVGRTQEKK